ncbi:MAG: glucans biosynthesis glucosyltransferase MdoH [Devosiaceae bacterium]|nr:glucans biosynthesis glucosyltransferase MdoH [Devosiaceae bacterium MH13]
MPADQILSTQQAPRPLLGKRKQYQSARRIRALQIVLMAIGTGACLTVFALALPQVTPIALASMALFAVSAVWISGGAATAIVGALLPKHAAPAASGLWKPKNQTALLFTMCGEDPRPLASHLQGLAADLEIKGLGNATRLFLLSDTSNPDAIAREEAALAEVLRDGTVSYRRRRANTGRKPGNIADWVRTVGHRFDHMLVLDADSRMSAKRIRTIIWMMERRPNLGLLQAGIALVPNRTAFGQYQRLSSRLLSPVFLRGFAATTGSTGNYWGHNALIRVAAFRDAIDLPVLSGRAPMGGSVLSHDFIEAAWIRRAGWEVELDPRLEGSAEDAPQTFQEFSKRDRRWCQGNLQHIRLLAEPGLHPLSRAHLALGVLSYLAAPIWLALLLLLTSGAVTLSNAWPLLPVLLLLLLPKVCALLHHWSKARTWRRRRIVLHAFANELAVSACVAPIMMIRQTGAVLSVLLGNDCGWKRPSPAAPALPQGVPEVIVAIGLGAVALIGQTGAEAWLLPVVGPLLLAPLIIRKLDAPA